MKSNHQNVCMVCGKPIEPGEPTEQHNAAVIGDAISIHGHKHCADFVNSITVMNRFRMYKKLEQKGEL